MSYFLRDMQVTESMADNLSPSADAVLAVIVLYKRPFKEVPCAGRLNQWLISSETKSTGLHLAHCLIYDNSPVVQEFESELPNANVNLVHDPFNGGTRAAYIAALKIAKEKSYRWILFLDHDTDLPENFFWAANQALATTNKDRNICAIVPEIFDGTDQISPSRITAYGRGYAKQGAWALTKKNTILTAIASASLVRTESLAASLPIPAALALDHLDHWLFREFQRGGSAIVVSSARVEHSLSVQSMKTIGADRYRSILAAELVYLKGGPQYPFFTHLAWHAARTVKLMLSTRRPALVRVCVRGFFDILFSK